MTQLDLAPQSFESSTTVPMESTYVRYKSLFKFTFAPCEYANYYRKFTHVPKMVSKKSHTTTVLDMHEFLNLYEKEWPKFKKESKTVPTPRTLELLVFDG